MNEEKIINKLFEHDERFERLENKIDDVRREVLQGMDEMTVILKRLDGERVFTYEMVKRIEERVDTHDREIQITRQDVIQLKTRLNVA